MGDANVEGSAAERALGPDGTASADDALSQLLEQVVLLARQTVVGADAVSITLAENGGYRTTSSSSDAAEAIDQAQYDGNDGPCLEAVRSGRQIAVAWDGEDGRWPFVRARAEELGMAAVLSTPLRHVGDHALGALNIYGRDRDGFRDSDLQTAETLSDHAAILLANARALVGANHLNEQLRAALASREIIGEAKGIIMERQSCTRDEAFDILRRASQRENRKLRDLAEELVIRVETRRGPPPRS